MRRQHENQKIHTKSAKSATDIAHAVIMVLTEKLATTSKTVVKRLSAHYFINVVGGAARSNGGRQRQAERNPLGEL